MRRAQLAKHTHTHGMSYVLFTSYARADASSSSGKQLLQQFLSDLSEAVGDLIADQIPPGEKLYFRDAESIQLGTTWPNELADAVRSSKICLALYSPAYFVSDWGGREFEAFQKRRAPIIPVLWVPAANIPKSAGLIQYKLDGLPVEYFERGMKQLMLQSQLKNAYWECIRILALRALEIYTPQPVVATDISLENAKSAWSQTIGGNEATTSTGAISKSCFVFVARDGWNWKPFTHNDMTIGAFSQLLSGELGFQYEEIFCDGELNENLKRKYRAKVPTLLLIDPSSLQTGVIPERMSEYDTQYLSNCGALVAWSEGPPIAESAADAWHEIHRLLPQKTTNPPPHHEWETIFSPSDLAGKAKAILEGIKLRLLQSILSAESTVQVLKAENPVVTATVAKNGIQLATAPQLIPSTAS